MWGDVWNFLTKEWHSYAAAVLASIVLMLFRNVRKWTFGLLLRGLDKWTTKATPMTRDDIENDRNIIAALVRLRLEMKADRVRVWAFVNGGTFTPGNPDWGVKMVYEVCDDGIQGFILSCQRLPVQAMYEIIGPLFDHPVMGVERMSCDVCVNRDNCSWMKKGSIDTKAWATTVDQLSHSAAKAMMMSHGIKYTLTVPMTNGSRMAGFILVSYHNDVRDTRLPCRPLIECALRLTYQLKRSSYSGRKWYMRLLRWLGADDSNKRVVIDREEED